MLQNKSHPAFSSSAHLLGSSSSIFLCSSYIWRDKRKLWFQFMQKHNKPPAEHHYCLLWSGNSCLYLTCAPPPPLPFLMQVYDNFVFQQQCPPTDLTFNFDANKQQRQLIAELENKNRWNLSCDHGYTCVTDTQLF